MNHNFIPFVVVVVVAAAADVDGGDVCRCRCFVCLCDFCSTEMCSIIPPSNCCSSSASKWLMVFSSLFSLRRKTYMFVYGYIIIARIYS